MYFFLESNGLTFYAFVLFKMRHQGFTAIEKKNSEYWTNFEDHVV
jgi:hypothetical protein